jgi:hypothetical protein
VDPSNTDPIGPLTDFTLSRDRGRLIWKIEATRCLTAGRAAG